MGIFDLLFGSDDPDPIEPCLPPGGIEVRLERLGPNKIAVIKEVRDATRLGLAETKRLVESAPAVVARVADEARARDLVERLRDVGATASVGGEVALSEGLHQVVLVRTGPNKIAVIKAIREHTGLGLREAKECSERLPSTLGPYGEERALQLLLALSDAGATAQIDPASP